MEKNPLVFQCTPATLIFLLLWKRNLLQGARLVFVKEGNSKGWSGLLPRIWVQSVGSKVVLRPQPPIKEERVSEWHLFERRLQSGQQG